MIVYLIQKIIFFLRSIPYYLQLRKSISLDARVISIGNISFGGTGKTSLVLFLAHELIHRTKTVLILSRGYKRKSRDMFFLASGEEAFSVEMIGDEPYMLKKNKKEAALLVHSHRAAKAQLHWDRVQSQYVLLDDAFQHWGAKRDLDIVLIHLLGWNCMGREPLDAISRAHCLVITHFEDLEEKEMEKRVRVLSSFFPHKKKPWHRDERNRSLENRSSPFIFFLRFKAIGLFQGTSLIFPLDSLPSRKFILLHGVAKHASVRKTVESLGLELLEEFSFPDHHWLSKKEAEAVFHVFKQHEKDSPLFLCTEKDYYRFLKVFEPYRDSFYYIKLKAELCFPLRLEGITGNEKDFWTLLEGKVS